MADTIKLLLIDDHAMFRDGLMSVLSHEGDMRLLGHCGSFKEALQLLDRQPDVIVLDAELGGEKSLDFVQVVRKKAVEVRMLILTDGVAPAEAVGLVQAGVAGIMHKQHTARELVETIRRVSAGQVFLEPPYLGALMRANDKSHQPGRKLTDRDRSVMRAVVQGLANREIGVRLKISEAAVKASLRVLFEKVGVKSRAQLVKVAMEGYRDQL